MTEISIVIQNDIFYSSTSPGFVSLPFYVRHDAYNFPDEEWTDFASPLLLNWTDVLIRNASTRDTIAELFFMDGPYRICVAKKGNKANLSFENVNKSLPEYSCEVTYDSLLLSIKNGISKVVEILRTSDRMNDFAITIKDFCLARKKISAHLKQAKQQDIEPNTR